MSARDSESGSSDYRGGGGSAGGLGNGGVGGGRGAGSGGGGAGRNGGIGSRTGMTTGKDWYGNTAFGRSGGNVIGYGMRDARSLGRAGMGPTMGTYGNFRTPTDQPMFSGSPVQNMTFNGMNMGQALSQAQRAQAAWRQAPRPASVAGLLGGVPKPPVSPSYDPLASIQPPEYNPLIDVQPGLEPLSGVPQAQLEYTFGPRTGMVPTRGAYDLGYGFSTTYANGIVNDPSYGFGAAGTIGNYAGSNWGGKWDRK